MSTQHALTGNEYLTTYLQCRPQYIHRIPLYFWPSRKKLGRFGRVQWRRLVGYILRSTKFSLFTDYKINKSFWNGIAHYNSGHIKYCTWGIVTSNGSSAGCRQPEEETITGNWYYIIVNPKRSQISFCLGPCGTFPVNNYVHVLKLHLSKKYHRSGISGAAPEKCFFRVAPPSGHACSELYLQLGIFFLVVAKQ